MSHNLSELINIGLLSLIEKSLSNLIALQRILKFTPCCDFLLAERMLFLISSSVVKVVRDTLFIFLYAAASRFFDSNALFLKVDFSLSVAIPLGAFAFLE